LGVEAVLLKDVDGVYEHDPKQSGPEPKRYEQISWDEAAQKAAPLIAPKALGFARKYQVKFRIGTPGIPQYTSVGATTGALKTGPKIQKLRVAMLGCGVVGGGVFRQIAAHSERFDLIKIMVRDVQKYIDQGYAPNVLTSDFADIIASKPDIFIDVSGPIDPALDFTKDMLARGVHVVSANKQAIAAGGQDLIDLAKQYKAQLLFSSAAGGGMPVLEMCVREKGRITRIEALLNGTTNYMLGEISAGKTYALALKEAQDKGFAEADPTSDVSGADAAAKIRLIAMLAFGQSVSLDNIAQDTIDGFVPKVPLKGAVKRVANIWQDQAGFSANLELKDLQLDNFLAQADGEEAHAVFWFNDGDSYRIRGKGAGRWPTTESVMADLFDISASYI
ncbi:MAG: hypothetical protein ABJG88_05475, partial [Litorimonas sp.]